MIRQPQQVSLLGKLATIVVGAALLVLGLMFSVVVIAVLVVLGIALWIYLRWKTRGLRNWAGTEISRAVSWESPRSEAEVHDVLARARRSGQRV